MTDTPLIRDMLTAWRGQPADDIALHAHGERMAAVLAVVREHDGAAPIDRSTASLRDLAREDLPRVAKLLASDRPWTREERDNLEDNIVTLAALLNPETPDA